MDGGFMRKRFAEAEFLDEIQTRVLRIFLLAIHSQLYSLRFFFFKLTQPLTVSRVQLLYTVKEKEEGKPDRKPNLLLYSLRTPYIQKPDNSQDYAQKAQRKILRSLIRLQGKGSSSHLASMWQIHPA
jgi:hypothetical protein